MLENCAQHTQSACGTLTHTHTHTLAAPPGGFEQFHVNVNPFWPNGSLLAGVEAEAPPSGSADDRVMPSSYRACVTNDPANRVPWPRPAGYDPAQFELLVRLAQVRCVCVGVQACG